VCHGVPHHDRAGGALIVLRNGHGRGAGSPRVEVLPAVELPKPLAPTQALPVVPPVFLRATFETWARRAAWPQERIDRRTGHTSKEMGDRYMRAAQTLAELRMAPFPDLTQALPEPTALARQKFQSAKAGT
jgi:hypothetical protein